MGTDYTFKSGKLQGRTVSSLDAKTLAWFAGKNDLKGELAEAVRYEVARRRGPSHTFDPATFSAAPAPTVDLAPLHDVLVRIAVALETLAEAQGINMVDELPGSGAAS